MKSAGKADLAQVIYGIVSNYLSLHPGNAEIAERAGAYALKRINEGMITSVNEAKIAWASFADGFCTHVHKGAAHGN